jgi:hypothetical protein
VKPEFKNEDPAAFPGMRYMAVQTPPHSLTKNLNFNKNNYLNLPQY